MANLETLEIRVAANAESAAQGLSHLIGSLSALSRGVGKAVGGLTRLNGELAKMKGQRAAKLPALDAVASTKSTKNIQASTKAIQQNFKARAEVMKQFNKNALENFRSEMYGPQPYRMVNPAKSAEEAQKARMASAAEYKQFLQSISKPVAEDTRMSASTAAEMGLLGKNAQYVADYGKAAQSNQAITETAQKASQAVKIATENTEECVKSAHSLRDGFSNLTSGIGKFFGRIGRIASTMLIRKALKLMTAAAKEGTENLYQYSKGMNGEFAGAMDRMASSLAQMKNAAGTAIAPALSAIIPVLNAISGAAITAFNALSQLFALLGGASTWTRATAVVQDYADATKKAGGGGGGLKEMLADFDELNVIASEGGGGGGGGGSGIEYADMFEQVSTFSKEIRDIVGWIKENMNSILGIAAAIGTAMLAWKVSDAFSGLIGTLAGIIAGGAIIAVTCQVVWLMDNQYFKDKNVGWVIGDLLTTALGATLASKVIGSVLGSGWGTVAAGITLELSALTTIVALIKSTDTSALSREGIIAALTAGLKAGAGLVVLGKGLLGMTWAKAIMYAAGPAVMTVGAAIAVKAIAMFDNEGLSADVVKSGLLGALGIGVGTGILFKAFGAALATAGVAGLIAGGAAILTLGAVIGIKALLKPDTKEMKLELTDEQVQAFVSQKMFDVDVKLNCSMIAERISLTEQERANVEMALLKALGTMKVVRLGIADQNDYADLKSEIDSVIESSRSYIEELQKTNKLTLQFVPSLVGSNDQEQANWYESSSMGWNTVSEFFANKGKELGSVFVENEKGEIQLKSPELLNTIMSEIERVTSAITKAGISSDASTDLVLKMSNMDKNSIKKVKDAFKEYKDELTEQYTELAKEAVKNQEMLAAALFEIDPNGDAYKEAKAKAEEMAKNITTAVDEEVKKASSSGRSIIAEYLMGEFGGINTASNSWSDYLVESGLSADNLKLALQQIIYEATGSKEVIEMMDLIDFTGWDLLTTEMKFNFMNALNGAFGASEVLEAAKSAGIDVGKLVEEGMSSNNDDIKNMAKFWKDLIDGELKPESEVGVGLADGQPNKIAEEVNSAIEGIKPKVTVEAEVNATVNTSVSIRGSSGYGVTGTQDASQNSRMNLMNAAGAYDIPRGDVFIANEAGAELVGSINGKTSVANQGQIIEGIAGGVERANAEQNQLLREQNSLLRELLTKDNTVRIGASASLGRTVKQSLDMYSRVGG